MALILAENGKQLKGISSPRRRNESLANWDSQTPPPPGYGVIYVIHHYVKGRMGYGTYVGLTRRAAIKRWSEHVTEAESYLRMGPRINKKGTEPRSNKRTYQYQSATNKRLHSAMAIAIGRQINEDFSNNFSFHVLGCYSLFTLDNVEAKLIQKHVGSPVAMPRSFREIRAYKGLNSKYESQKIPGTSFNASGYTGDKAGEPNSISFTQRVLALEAYMNYESESDDKDVPDFLKVRPKTPDELYNGISKYFLERASSFIPGPLRKSPTKLKNSIIQILDIKIKGGEFSYLIFKDFPTASLSRLRIMLNTFFGSATGRGVGKSTKSKALERIGPINEDDRELLIPKNQKDRIFTKKADVEKVVFQEIERAAKKPTAKNVVLSKALQRLENLKVKIAELMAAGIEAGDNIAKFNSIQEKLSKLLDSYNEAVRSYSFRENIEMIIVRNKDED